MIYALDCSLPPPTSLQEEDVLRRLHRELGPSKLLERPEARERYGRDESEAVGRLPCAVVLPASSEDVARALACCDAAGVPVTPRGGGTGRVGGAVPLAGGVVLSLENLNRIVDLDEQEGSVVVEAGVVLGRLQNELGRAGWFYPPDPGSRDDCTLGGNVAANAGGPRAFKYGVTADYLLGADVALMSGIQHTWGRQTRKGVTGYDLRALLAGSEGTLAVASRLRLRLLRPPEAQATALALFDDAVAAAAGVQAILRTGAVPACLELLDEFTLEALRAAGNAIPSTARALLLVEVDGSEESCERDLLRLAEAMEPLAQEVLVAQGPEQRERLWSARREMSRAVRSLSRFKLSEDVVVPRRELPALLAWVRSARERHNLLVLAYGHAGDGNLHVNFLWNEDGDLPRVQAAIADLFGEVIRLGGTLSGEHGIGALKAPYLKLEQTEPLRRLQQELKRVFDPRGLLNPGKIFLPT